MLSGLTPVEHRTTHTKAINLQGTSEQTLASFVGCALRTRNSARRRDSKI